MDEKECTQLLVPVQVSYVSSIEYVPKILVRYEYQRYTGTV